MKNRFSAFSVLALLFLLIAGSAGAKTVTVHVGPNGSMSYSPSTVSINVGDAVQWVWDSADHSVTAGTASNPNPAQFDSGIHNPPFTFEHTFDTAGNFPYYCRVHGAAMSGTVAVSAASPTPSPSPKPTPKPTPTPSATPILPRVQPGPVRIALQPVASGLQAPTDLVPINDGSGRLVIVQQRGRVLLLKHGHLTQTPFLDVSARLVQFTDPDAIPGPNYDERGLLGIAFHPGFASPGSPGFRKLYTFTNEPVSGTADFTVPMSGQFDNQVVLAEWQVSASNPDVVDTSTRREILRVNHPQFNHNGGQLAFRPGERYLYFSIGDGGAANDVGDGHNPAIGNGQDKTRILGKLLRIDPLDPSLTGASADPISANGKYRIPASNPFVSTPNVVREIYAYGFRNPYRFSFDQPSGRLILGDAGQDHIEEVDLVTAGKNYGWRRKEGTFLFDPKTGNVSRDRTPDPKLTDPVAEYDHESGIAVIGGFVYRGKAVPALQGMYVFGDFSTSFSKPDGHLFYLDTFSGGTIRQLVIGADDHDLGLFVKAFGRDAAGEIYVLADSSLGPSGAGGRVLKIVPIAASPAFVNLSTRMNVQTGDNVLIGGFIVTGSAPKRVALRAIGPSLKSDGQPLAGRLPDPLLELHGATGLLKSNNNWQNGPDKQELIDRKLDPGDPKEAALIASLQPGNYTGIVRDANGASGIGLVELFDLDQSAPANPANVSTRGFVQTKDDVMIGGFIIGGSVQRTVLVRAIGPALADAGVSNALQNPVLQLFDHNGTMIASNDDWKSDQAAAIRATGLQPKNPRESAILKTLGPAGYTAIVRGANDTTGVALVEAYQITK